MKYIVLEISEGKILLGHEVVAEERRKKPFQITKFASACWKTSPWCQATIGAGRSTETRDNKDKAEKEKR